jgi:hypothetical protein
MISVSVSVIKGRKKHIHDFFAQIGIFKSFEPAGFKIVDRIPVKGPMVRLYTRLRKFLPDLGKHHVGHPFQIVLIVQTPVFLCNLIVDACRP